MRDHTRYVDRLTELLHSVSPHSSGSFAYIYAACIFMGPNQMGHPAIDCSNLLVTQPPRKHARLLLLDCNRRTEFLVTKLVSKTS